MVLSVLHAVHRTSFTGPSVRLRRERCGTVRIAKLVDAFLCSCTRYMIVMIVARRPIVVRDWLVGYRGTLLVKALYYQSEDVSHMQHTFVKLYCGRSTSRASWKTNVKNLRIPFVALTKQSCTLNRERENGP